MKKRVLWILFLFASLSLLCAFDWPPEPYEMPRTVLTPEIVTGSFQGLRLSIRSIADTGLIILGILIPFSMISGFFNKYVFRPLRIQEGVAKNQLRREIRAADRTKNRDAIIDDRVAEMEINNAARKKFRAMYPDADLEERLYQKQLSYSAELEYAALHPDEDIERAVYRREVAFNADQEYQFYHPDREVEQAVHHMEVRAEARKEYRRKNGLE